MTVSHQERYILDREIGSKGGMGKVWLATDTLLDRPVAIKYPRFAPRSPDSMEQLLKEARILACLNHPNITAIYDFFIDKDESRFYLVMEYVPGKDLSKIIQQSPLTLEVILDIAMGVLQALDYAHRQGIVHRDIKPANVMIDEDVKLTDFGLSSLQALLKSGTGFMAGTPAYMAPEQIEGRSLDGRADLYSLGVMLFEMFTGGHLPFDHSDQVELFEAHLHLPPPPLSRFVPDIPVEIEHIVSRLLAKDPHDRYPTAKALKRSLGSYRARLKSGEWLSTSVKSAKSLSVRHNMPAAITPFVGRAASLTELNEHLRSPEYRLMTLVGPGGCGKTRLALEAATAVINNFAHGAFFVSLAPLESIEAILPTIAEALHFSFREDREEEPKQQLLDYLRGKTMLLVMDNFEHLLEDLSIVIDILKMAPNVKILATSRVRLNLQGEYPYHLAGMAYPDEATEMSLGQPSELTRYSAVELFLESARQAQSNFEITTNNMTDVVKICRQVQGMPLGILLAAAWVHVLTPAEIATEIGRSLDFLETDRPDVPDRQQSLRAVFDHTWSLLTEREREVFQGLSVFRGGFTRQAAQHVTGASLPELRRLVNKSLLYRTPTGRYEVHELLRQYAAEKLARSPAAYEAVRDRHSSHYLTALRRWEPDLKSPRHLTALTEIEADIENAGAAWNWAVERGKVEQLEPAIYSLFSFYGWHSRLQEAEAACRLAANKLASVEDSATATAGTVRVILAQILSIRSHFLWFLGKLKSANQLLQESLALLEKAELDGHDTRKAKAYVFLEMGYLASDQNREEARQLFDQSLALFRVVDDQWGEAKALSELGHVAWNLGNYDDAWQQQQRSLVIRQAIGNQLEIADSLQRLSQVALRQGQLVEAESLARESLAIKQAKKNLAGIADSLQNLGITLLFRGKFDEAHAVIEESLTYFNDLGIRNTIAFPVTLLGIAETHLGNYDRACEQGQHGLTLAQETGYQWGIGRALCFLGQIALVKEQYEVAQRLTQESVTIFREVGPRDGLNLSLAMLGIAVFKLGKVVEAKRHFAEVLRTANEIGAYLPLTFALSALAALLADAGEQEQAVELYALASRFPNVANSRWFEDIAGRDISAVVAALPLDLVVAAQERGKARNLEATVIELLDQLS